MAAGAASNLCRRDAQGSEELMRQSNEGGQRGFGLNLLTLMSVEQVLDAEGASQQRPLLSTCLAVPPDLA